MKKIINMSLFAIALFVPNYFIGLNQPISLTEQAAVMQGKSINNKEELAKLKASYSEEIYNRIAKIALPNIVKSTKANNIWEAAREVKALSNDTLNNDVELAGKLINALADKYSLDFNKLFKIVMSTQYPNPPTMKWDDVEDAENVHFAPNTYINFAAEVLATPGADQWLEQNPLEYVARVMVPESRPE